MTTQTPRAHVQRDREQGPVRQEEAIAPCPTSSQKSSGITCTTSVHGSSQSPSQVQGEGEQTPSPDGEQQNLERACGTQNIPMVMFGKYNGPQLVSASTEN